MVFCCAKRDEKTIDGLEVCFLCCHEESAGERHHGRARQDRSVLVLVLDADGKCLRWYCVSSNVATDTKYASCKGLKSGQ